MTLHEVLKAIENGQDIFTFDITALARIFGEVEDKQRYSKSAGAWESYEPPSSKVLDAQSECVRAGKVKEAKKSKRKKSKRKKRIKHAAEVAEQFAGIDGGHHKQWVIDQMLRAMLGTKGYREFVAKYNAPEEYEDWDKGSVAP